jgi:hypothetical protein
MGGVFALDPDMSTSAITHQINQATKHAMQVEFKTAPTGNHLSTLLACFG